MSDITKHVFSDGDVDEVTVYGDSVYIDTLCTSIDLYKEDVIALAKHFELTGEDLWT